MGNSKEKSFNTGAMILDLSSFWVIQEFRRKKISWCSRNGLYEERKRYYESIFDFLSKD
jgi:hypothetical protein